MLLISEWLPNPKGDDVAGEWIEVWNSGSTGVDLSGWRLTPDGKKFFALEGWLAPGDYLLIPRSSSKITLKNSDGRLALYDPAGKFRDQGFFSGTAPEGESINRDSENFFFGEPTPGLPNNTMSSSIVYNDDHPPSMDIGAGASSWADAGWMLLGTAFAMAALLMFILNSYEDISDFLLYGDKNPGRGSG